ncbi:MAG: cupin domain-containing protein [Candidatus Omnitrophica bacterium]|nr:cupin domain-containing protein [Candidatus Omnitrophota bacterium]MBU1925045.1 cupin domain-containing protein [Candidatus Omnitrophota bacterium]
MFISSLKECKEFIAEDDSVLRELLHAEKGEFAFGYSLAHATVKPNTQTRPHRLQFSEVYYILEGKGRMHIDAEVSPVFAGNAVYIPPGSLQYIENREKTDLKFLCIVDPAWRKEAEEIL